MKPIDYRNETWNQVWERMDFLRSAVYRALQQHGPCTTRQLADHARLDLLSVRPRVTELLDLGLAELATHDKAREGIYQAVPYVIARARFDQLRAQALANQLTLL